MIDSLITKLANKEITIEDYLKCIMFTRFESFTECKEFLDHYNIPNITDGFSEIVNDMLIEIYFRRGQWECMIAKDEPIHEDDAMYLSLKWRFHYKQ